MDKPNIGPGAVGLGWRPRRNAWAAVWLARQDIARDGFKPATHQIGVYTSQPTEEEAKAIVAECDRLQREMYAFVERRPKQFDGTIRALVSAYQTDPDCTYQTMRFRTRRDTDAMLRRLVEKYGKVKLRDLDVREFKHWYESFRWPDGKDGRELVATGHAMMTTVRMVIGYGRLFEIEKAPRDKVSECARLKEVLSDMSFEVVKPRTEAMTLRQCEDIIAAAHAAGLPSIALAQALQFDLRARQKDIIGEWVPVSEPGISVINPYHARKWLRGLRHEEISSTMVLNHPASKTGKMIERDLTLYPMVMAEIDKIPAERRTGPIVVCELTGRPWVQNHFRVKWRDIATKAKVPTSVYNMDSRAGGITETIEATGGDMEAARKEADHATPEQTANYSRRKRQSNDSTAAKVLDFRAKNRG